jgi:CRP/FNR family transcriptional regulator, cyclic AMP receptor protein
LARSDPDQTVREVAASTVRGEVVVEALSTIPLMERILFLRRVPLFSELSPEDLKHVADATTEQLFSDGELIAEHGEAGDEMHIVVAGEIRVVLESEKGRPTEVARRTRGDYVGEMAIITDQPRMASLVASGSVRTLSIDRKRFERIVLERPQASLAVMRKLCDRLREFNAGDASRLTN